MYCSSTLTRADKLKRYGHRNYLMKVIQILGSNVTIDCEAPFEEVTANGTTITSPNYPNDYGNNRDCQVSIRYSGNQTVVIRFEAFTVESHSSCNYDYLAVHDGSSTSAPMIESKICGTSPAGTRMVSTGNIITLHFHSDSSRSRSGFQIYTYTGKKADTIPKCYTKIIKLSYNTVFILFLFLVSHETPGESCTAQAPLDFSCCSPSSPCNHGGGDCDVDDDCAGEFSCGNANCHSEFGYDWHSSVDCCTGK